MNKIKNNINKIVILIVLVSIGTFIYNYITKEKTADLTEQVVGEDSAEAREILQALSDLETIELDNTFFTDQDDFSEDGFFVFSVSGKKYELKDFSNKEIVQKEFGKNNPLIEKNSSNFTSQETEEGEQIDSTEEQIKFQEDVNSERL